MSRALRALRNCLLVAFVVIAIGACREEPGSRDWIYLFTHYARTDRGLPSLWQNDYLQERAVAHSMDMCRQQRGLFHTNLGEFYNIQPGQRLGENVGYHSLGATEMWNAFLASRAHAANIFGNWTEHGVGAVRCDIDGLL